LTQNRSIQGATATTAAATAGGARSSFTPALLASLLLYAAIALWLASHPVSLSSDDALFLLHALKRFSVLDFSPQFPGYPGFVALGRLALSISHDPLDALGLTTLLVALALPPMAGLVVWRVTGDRWRALLAFLLTLACPLLPDIALSLLSDGSGILFLLTFLSLLPRASQENLGFLQPFLAGAALAFAGACRPSDAVLLACALLGALIALPRAWKALLAGGLAVTIPTLAVLFALEGTLYWQEGLRFFAGNAMLWGNTPFAGTSARHRNWLGAVASLPGGPVLIALPLIAALAVLRRRRAPPAAFAAALALPGHMVWILAFQNPDHLRHLAPILILGGILLATMKLPGAKSLTAIAASLYAIAAFWCMALTLDPNPEHLPPLAQALSFLRAEPQAVVATNNGVFTLRTLLPRHHIYDMHYPADARLGLAMAKGPAYRLTTTRPENGNIVAAFPGRFAGEETMWLERKRSPRPDL